MNPLIRPLIDCIRIEVNFDLQFIAAKHLTNLLRVCSTRQPNPVPKIFKNLLTYLCNDPFRTPFVQQMPLPVKLAADHASPSIHMPDKEPYDINRYFGIMADNVNANSVNPFLNTQISSSSSSSNGTSTQQPPQQPIAVQDEQQKLKCLTERRGSQQTLRSICIVYNRSNELELIIPEMVQVPVNAVLTYYEQFNQLDDVHLKQLVNNSRPAKIDLNDLDYLNKLIAQCEAENQGYQDLINNLNLIEYLTSTFLNANKSNECYLDSIDYNNQSSDEMKRKQCVNRAFIGLMLKKDPSILAKIFLFLKCPFSGVRNAVARCLSSICLNDLLSSSSSTIDSSLLEMLLEHLENSNRNLFQRQGVVELVYYLNKRLEHLIIPYIVLFIIPVLKLMCDHDYYVRSVSSHCFANLIKLYPLSSGSVDDDCNNQAARIERQFMSNKNLDEIRLRQQEFLNQLMDQRKLKAYALPVDCLKEVELRPYQQQGVNWLGFLKQYNLNGIL